MTCYTCNMTNVEDSCWEGTTIARTNLFACKMSSVKLLEHQSLLSIQSLEKIFQFSSQENLLISSFSCKELISAKEQATQQDPEGNSYSETQLKKPGKQMPHTAWTQGIHALSIIHPCYHRCTITYSCWVEQGALLDVSCPRNVCQGCSQGSHCPLLIYQLFSWFSEVVYCRGRNGLQQPTELQHWFKEVSKGHREVQPCLRHTLNWLFLKKAGGKKRQETKNSYFCNVISGTTAPLIILQYTVNSKPCPSSALHWSNPR